MLSLPQQGVSRHDVDLYPDQKVFQVLGVNNQVETLLDRDLPKLEVRYESKPGYMFRLVEVAKDLVVRHNNDTRTTTKETTTQSQKHRRCGSSSSKVLSHMVQVDWRHHSGDIKILLHLF